MPGESGGGRGARTVPPLALATSHTEVHVAIEAGSSVTLGAGEPPADGRAGEQTVAGGGSPDAVVATFELATGLYVRGRGYGGGGADDA